MSGQFPPFRLPGSPAPDPRGRSYLASAADGIKQTAETALRAMVKHVLQHSEHHEWTLQGFGMLRTYLDDGWRLHVWHSDYSVPGVTTIHDHPWHFESLIVAGILLNQRFELVSTGIAPATHMMRTIKPGIGLKVLEHDQHVQIRPAGQREIYLAGERYHQSANEIHESMPLPGTVTLVRRERVGDDVARSFYPAGEQWVSGEPRAATAEEARAICAFSLSQWFGETTR
jgi:hypothetical protein